MKWAGPVIAACALLGASCDGAGLELFIELRTDFVAGGEFARVRTEWAARPLDQRGTRIASSEVAVTVADDFLAGARVAELAVQPGTVYVRITLLDAAGAAVAEQRATIDVHDDLVVTLVITRSCRGVACGDGDVCQGGRCVDARCTSATPELCDAPRCEVDSDCSVSFACAVPECIDGSCFEVASDALCAAGERCDAVAGCVPREPAGMDAGVVPTPDDAGTPGPLDAGPAWPCSEVERVAGTNRYRTAVAFSQRFFPGGASAVVLTKNDAPEVLSPDGVIAPPLARRWSAPLLLTDGTSLTPETSAEIDRLGATRAFLIGGTGAISSSVESSLESRGLTVVRYAGSNRAETAVAVATAVGSSGGRAFVVNGWDATLVDALIAGAAGAALRVPVLFVRSDRIPSPTEAFLRNHGISRIYVVGGAGDVSDATVAALSARATVTRLFGATRSHTAEAVARTFAGEVPAYTVLIAHQSQLTDGMAASASAGAYLLLTNESGLSDPTRAFLGTFATRAVVVGGSALLPVAIEQEACEILTR